MFRALLCGLPLVLVAATPAAEAPPPTAEPIVFEKQIRPIFKANCFHCHGGADEVKGNLDLRLKRLLVKGGDSGPAIEPGKPEASYLYERIQKGEMPPGDKKLSAEQIALIGAWITAGAPTARPEPEQLDRGLNITPEERSHWSFQPLTSPAVPPRQAGDRSRTDIDAFLHESLRAKGLSFAPDADKLTLLKRVAFDLTGLPPTPEETALFMADEARDAYERLVDRLLASPHYGERWGRHWLDVAGYTDSDGYTDADTVRPYAYKYRDYVVRSFNADKPLDQFLSEQLAGDELLAGNYTNLDEESLDKLIATGYLRMAADGTATGGIDQDTARNQVVSDTIKIVSTSLLGLSVGCAQCHDHRYDPIPQTDYYRLRALLEPSYDWKNWRQPAQRLISLYTDAQRAESAQIETEASKIAQERAAKENEYMKAALEKELEKFPEEQRAALRAAVETAGDKRTDEQKKLLAANPSVSFSPGVLYQYNQAAADDLKKYDARIGEIRAKKPVEDFVQVLTEVSGQIPVTYLFHRGDPQQPKDPVPPGVLTICAPPGAPVSIAADDPALPTSGRRLAFARWLASDKNPLTARVLVNRVWMHHFGRGIVNTPSDFGALGEQPSHPALLDWLARNLIEGGWKLKRLHKLMLMSTAYRQSSQRDAKLAQLDPEDRLYARMSVRRLDAETVRDRILVTSGAMNRKMFGPAIGVKEDDVGQVVVAADVPAGPEPPAAANNAFRRSLYVQVRRSQPLAMLQTFDAPVMETNCDRRASSTVATQSLMLMNSDFLLQQSGYFATRLRKEVGSEPALQVRKAWQLAYARDPSAVELTQSLDFLTARTEQLKQVPAPNTPADPARDALTSLCQVLLSTNEFLYVD